jgi:hypothetical protein
MGHEPLPLSPPGETIHPIHQPQTPQEIGQDAGLVPQQGAGLVPQQGAGLDPQQDARNVKAAQINQLSMDLLSPKAMEDMFEAISNQTFQNQMKLLISHPSDLFQNEVSYYV